MTRFAEAYTVWLADYYLLATVLLALALAGIAFLKQPAQRLTVTKSTLIALVLLAILCAVPGWSVVHLLAADRPAVLAQLPREQPMVVSQPAARPNPTQSNPVRRPAPSALGTPTAADDLAKPTIVKMSWPALLAIAHATGMGCIVVWLALGWVASVQLRRAAQAAPPNLCSILDELASLNRPESKRLQLFTHDRLDVAVALGVWRPTILLPSRWLNQFPLPFREGLGEGSVGDDLRTVLAHESTHILNHDLQWVAIARASFVALWANPLFWLAKRRLRLDQEALADAAAAEITSRQQYAEQLVAWARNVRSRPALHLSSAVGLWEGPSQLRQRIAILLDEQLTVLRNCSRRWRLTVGLLAVAAAMSLSTVTLQPASRANESSPTEKAATTATASDKSKAQPTANPAQREPNVVNRRVLDEAVKNDAKPVSDTNEDTLAGVFIAADSKPGTPNTITGQCVDENGKLLADVNVVLARVWYQDAARREIVAKQTTVADGSFRFEKVVDVAHTYPNGKIPKMPDFAGPYYQVSARKSGCASQNTVIEQNDVARRGSTMNLKMPPASTLRGRISNPKGEPVAGALVSVGFSQLDRWEGYQTVRSGPDGRFEINDVPPFDSKNQKKAQTFGAVSQDELVFPRVIFVNHPDFANRAMRCEKIPGTQDVQLKAAAIITGRVIDGASKQPVANAAVRAFPSRQGNTLWDAATSFDSVRTDARGEYRITSLSEATYDLWAVAPNRVNEGVKNLKTSAERATTAPDLVMTVGGTVRVRLIDEKTRQPIPLNGDERAWINVSPSPPMGSQATVEAKNGRFEVHAVQGEDRIDSVSASSNDAMKWIIRPGEPITVRVVEGKSTDVDVRVQDVANMERWNRIGALFSRALNERSTDERKAIADFEQIIKLDPPYPHNVGTYACLASILATSADDSVRDGKRALELAQKAQQLEDKPSAFVLDALAAAYAEVGDFDQAVASEKKAIELAKKEQKRDPPTENLKLYEAHKPRREPNKKVVPPADKGQGATAQRSEFRLVQNTTPVADRAEPKRPPGILGYGDDKPDGKKSLGGSGEMIQFELPRGVTKIKGIRIHGSRYGLPQAPKEDFEITFLNEKRDETLHSEAGPYRLFNRGKEQWVRVAFKDEVELPRKFWVCLNFNAAATKGVYVSYDTSTKGKYSRVGQPGDTEEPRETDFNGDWMVQLLLAKPEK